MVFDPNGIGSEIVCRFTVPKATAFVLIAFTIATVVGIGVIDAVIAAFISDVLTNDVVAVVIDAVTSDVLAYGTRALVKVSSTYFLFVKFDVKVGAKAHRGVALNVLIPAMVWSDVLSTVLPKLTAFAVLNDVNSALFMVDPPDPELSVILIIFGV